MSTTRILVELGPRRVTLAVPPAGKVAVTVGPKPVTAIPMGGVGPRGMSAYQVAVLEGFVGTEVEWLADLEGSNAYEVALANGFVGSQAAWLTSLVGLSAYQIAVLGGFVGNQAAWIASLEGTSAYEAAVAGGFVGNQAAWIASLEGTSAYEVAVANGFVGNQAAWLASLVGPQGAAATIDVASVTTGPPGSPADVVNSGTSGAAELDFTIPEGQPGVDGDATVNWRSGGWQTATFYPAPPDQDLPDAVQHLGGIYICEVTHTSDASTEPGVGVDWLTVWSLAGAAGASATITVGTVSTLASGSPATVVNAGDDLDGIFDFGIPAGVDGTDGIDGTDGVDGMNGIDATVVGLAANFIESGCVWTADAPGTTRAASMTAGIVWIAGKRLTVAAVTARTFTASKDTYVDFKDAGGGVASVTYTEVANNAASPALAGGGTVADTVRDGVVVTGASSIAAQTSINQGDPNAVLPIASSVAYSITDSLGNLLYPTRGQRLVGYAQIVATFTTTATPTTTDVTGLATTFIVPPGAPRKVRARLVAPAFSSSAVAGTAVTTFIRNGSTTLALAQTQTMVSNRQIGNHGCEVTMLLQPGTYTFKASVAQNAAGTLSLAAAATFPASVSVELA
jgi:hypothetical protein